MTDQNIPDGFLMDPQGRLCRIENIRPQDLLVDQTVTKIRDYALDLSAQITRFKQHTYEDVATTLDILREKYGSNRGGAKGNITLVSFDGLSKVEVQVQQHIDFGPELRIAKELVDECILDWSSESKAHVQSLLNHAFSVDKGRVNREALFSLKRVEIDDERWRQAVRAINDSIRVTGSKSYVRFYQRETAESPWEAISINIANA
ncbi:DUF3164 family protein [Sneathiella sp.]|uniref:DUF3164 family protein n=1 Tax=Sneathiella sp. TaxID=1964365 RepID=UPI002FDFE1D9